MLTESHATGFLDFARNDILIQRFSYSNVISTSDLPALNATFNLVSTIFISTGWYFIRHGAWRRRGSPASGRVVIFRKDSTIRHDGARLSTRSGAASQT